MTLTARLLLIAAAMSAVLIGLVASHAAQRSGGQEIRLAMEPVDPRDILLGHYVIIETPAHRFSEPISDDGDLQWRAGDDIFVSLAPDDNGALRPISVHRRRQDARHPYLSGKVRNAFDRWERTQATSEIDEDGKEIWTPSEPIPGTRSIELRMVFNLERYFAEEKAALALEAMRRDDRLRLIVSLSPRGHAVIKGLEIDGEAHYDTLF